MKLVTNKFKSGGLHEKHVVATWNLGNHLSICFQAQGNQEKPVSRWHVVLTALVALGRVVCESVLTVLVASVRIMPVSICQTVR